MSDAKDFSMTTAIIIRGTMPLQLLYFRLNLLCSQNSMSIGHLSMHQHAHSRAECWRPSPAFIRGSARLWPITFHKKSSQRPTHGLAGQCHAYCPRNLRIQLHYGGWSQLILRSASAGQCQYHNMGLVASLIMSVMPMARWKQTDGLQKQSHGVPCSKSRWVAAMTVFRCVITAMRRADTSNHLPVSMLPGHR